MTSSNELYSKYQQSDIKSNVLKSEPEYFSLKSAKKYNLELQRLPATVHKPLLYNNI